ncbi:hypothetical protein CJ030_MR2G012420 [Morella rubra]|uniref:Pentatricopeptide repeat-containing protein n=1 Tax=Morella rubra TaxID=262757 RepID=A0A6A1WEY9_9ROSI|nr:hypothetical protein CJ030_MR2G012420 [Morella rubra]
MGGLPAKLMATVVAVLLLVGDIQTTSALLPYAGRKSLWPPQTTDAWMKRVPRKEGSTEGLNIGSKQIVPLVVLRGKELSPPPSPVRNGRSSMKSPPPSPPPLVAIYTSWVALRFSRFQLADLGQGIRGFCLTSGFDANGHVGSVLVSMYSRCNCMNSAYGVFCSLFHLDLVTWSALITGYSQSGDQEKALYFFKKLNMDTASQLANERPGCEIHGYVLRHGFESDVMVCSALIDMYSKCGFVGFGIRVFQIMPKRNIVSYNSVISGLGLHGLASEAFKIFDEILEKGFVPDKSTFSAILCACCHGGLVQDGQEIFRKMKDKFGIQARNEHYVYMVKLLGMAGELEEAYKLILSLPEPVDCGIWGALLSCCDACGNSELAEIVTRRLFDNNPEKNAYRVMLSNIYAVDGRWDDVQRLMRNDTTVELRKMPGVSWIGGSSKFLLERDIHY